jgi:hypothetical protein
MRFAVRSARVMNSIMERNPVRDLSDPLVLGA